MRKLKPYLSIKRDEGHNEFKVYAVLEIPSEGDPSFTKPIEIVNTKLAKSGLALRRGIPPRKIECSLFEIQLTDRAGAINNGGIHHFESDVFTRDKNDSGVELDHVWIKITGIDGLNPDGGAVGNYDDPDDD